MEDSVKLTLVEQALQSNYSRKKLDRVSLRQFVNRLLLLTQKPRIFLFYKKCKKGGGWEYSFSTHGDVLYQNDFKTKIKDTLHQVIDNKQYYKNPNSTIWPEEPQEIGNTGYGIIIVAIEAKSKKGQRVITFTSPNKYDENKNLIEIEYTLLKRLWDSFLGCEFSKTLGVEARLKKRLWQISKNPKREKPPIKTSTELFDHKLDPSDKEFIHKQLGYLSEIINDCYNDICETPLVCNQGKIPPNIFFFVRYYYTPETINRFQNIYDENDAYPYSLKIIIPKTQRKHLLTTLESIANSNINFTTEAHINTWNYQYKLLPGYEEIYSQDSLQCDSCYPVPELDFEFWHKIKTRQFEEILDDIQRPFTQEARSFVDPALMTGFVHYRSGVYIESGMERVTEEAKKLGFKSPDIRRLVYLHYLFSAAAPDSNHKNLGAMTVPLNVSNQPYVAIVQAVVTKNESDPDYTDQISWPQNYHFFTDVARHCVRKLRYHSKTQYILQIEKVVYKAFKKTLKAEGGNAIFINLAEAQRIINKNLLLLSRVWPYPNVSIEIRQNISRPNKYFLPILNAIDRRTGLFFSINNNPFFIQQKENDNLNLMEIDDTVLLTYDEVKQAFVNTLLYLEELISISILKNGELH